MYARNTGVCALCWVERTRSLKRHTRYQHTSTSYLTGFWFEAPPDPLGQRVRMGSGSTGGDRCELSTTISQKRPMFVRGPVVLVCTRLLATPVCRARDKAACLAKSTKNNGFFFPRLKKGPHLFFFASKNKGEKWCRRARERMCGEPHDGLWLAIT